MCRTQVSGYEIAAGCFRAHPRRTSTRCILAGDRRGSKTSPDVGRICASRSHAICQSGKSSQGSFTSYDLNRTDLNKLSPQGRRDDMPPPAPVAVRLVADLRPSADGSAVCTSLVAGQLQAASEPIA